jgi:predicted MFS family arabinose efflux permease
MWAGQTVSMLGDGVHGVALAWLVLTLTGSPITLGAVIVTGTLPRTALMLFGGALTDRLSARTLLLTSNLARCVLAALLAGLVLGGLMQLWELFVIEFLFGSADGLFIPALSAVVPDLVDDANLVNANALMGTSEQASMLAGPSAGGVLVALVGTWGAFLANAASFLVAAAGAFPARRAARHHENHPHIGAAIAEGVNLIRSDKELRAVFSIAAVTALASGSVFLIGIPMLARTRFGLGATGLGLVLSAWGLGQLAGALTAARTGLPRRWGYIIIAMSAANAVVYAAMGVTTSIWVVIALLIPLGFGAAYSDDVARPVWIQRHSRPGMMGRIFSLLELPYHSIAPIGMLVFGAIATKSLTVAFEGAAAIMVAAAVAYAVSHTARHLSMERS